MCEALVSIPTFGGWELKKKRKGRRYLGHEVSFLEALLHSLRNVSYHFYLQCWHTLSSGENFDLIYDPLTRGISELTGLPDWPGPLKENGLELLTDAGIKYDLMVPSFGKMCRAADPRQLLQQEPLESGAARRRSGLTARYWHFTIWSSVLPFQPVFLCFFDSWRKEVGNGFPVLVCLIPRKVWFVASVWKTRKNQLFRPPPDLTK